MRARVDAKAQRVGAMSLGPVVGASADAADGRAIAELMLNARGKGQADTAKVIGAFEDVARLDPAENWDWVVLTRLYMDAGRMADAASAAQSAAKTASTIENGNCTIARPTHVTAPTRKASRIRARTK